MKLDFTTHWLITAGGAFLLLFFGQVVRWLGIRSERKRASPQS